MDYIDEVYQSSTDLAKNAYNLLTNHLLKGPDVSHKENVEMFTLLSRVIDAQHIATKELYTILVESDDRPNC